jgi:hypothetical protein
MAHNLQCEKFPSPLHQTKRLDDVFGPDRSGAALE